MGGSSKTAPSKGAGSPANPVSKEVAAALNGIPQSGATLGNPNAPVTLRYYGDLQCPVCKDFTLGALPSIIQNYVRTGKVKIEYMSLQTATREPETFKTQQVAALAAGSQKRAWNYIELFYHQQGEENTEYVTEAYLQKLARQVPGLNLTAWTAARSNPKYVSSLAADAQSANDNAFTGTPSFLIGKTGGSLSKLEYTSLSDPTSFNEAIETQLKS
jgi:protein-disulfide isomerase